jgi:hypothetical protein
MRRNLSLFPSVLVLAYCIGCAGAREATPVILYGGQPRPADQISEIRVIKTHPDRGNPTIIILRITRVGDSTEVLFNAQEGSNWAPPNHFGGPPPTVQYASTTSPGDALVRAEVLPGSYQIDYLYAPAVDRWGWTHQSRIERTTRLDCMPGYTYLLRGRLIESEEVWILDTTEVPHGSGEAGGG